MYITHHLKGECHKCGEHCAENTTVCWDCEQKEDNLHCTKCKTTVNNKWEQFCISCGQDSHVAPTLAEDCHKCGSPAARWPVGYEPDYSWKCDCGRLYGGIPSGVDLF